METQLNNVIRLLFSISLHAVNACNTQLKRVESVCPKTTSKVLPNGVPCDGPAPSVIKLNGQYHERSPSEDISRSISITAGVSSAVSSVVDATSESSTTLTEMAPPKSSSSNRTAKVTWMFRIM